MTQLPWFLCLGVATGAVGALFLKGLTYSGGVVRAVTVPVYVRLGLGGLVVGIIALKYPGVWGNGYVVTNRILHETSSWPRSRRVGLPGGAFSREVSGDPRDRRLRGRRRGVHADAVPRRGLGSDVRQGLRALHLGEELPIPVFAVVGMGSMLAATTRSPLLAMIMVFEIHSIIP